MHSSLIMSAGVMSFLLDPPALVIIGILISRYTRSQSRRNQLAAAIVILFIVGSTLLYLDLVRWWFGEWINGSNWMLNSGLNTNLTRQPGIDVLAVVLFAAYPLWMKFGLDIGSMSLSHE